jgi:hypothetical protein
MEEAGQESLPPNLSLFFFKASSCVSITIQPPLSFVLPLSTTIL